MLLFHRLIDPEGYLQPKAFILGLLHVLGGHDWHDPQGPDCMESGTSSRGETYFRRRRKFDIPENCYE